MQVYAQNEEVFVDIINNCLKFTKAEAQVFGRPVSLEIVSLLIDLIAHITKRSKAMGIEVDLPKFLRVFETLLDILEPSCVFEIWMKLLKQFKETIILNSNFVHEQNSD